MDIADIHSRIVKAADGLPLDKERLFCRLADDIVHDYAMGQYNKAKQMAEEKGISADDPLMKQLDEQARHLARNREVQMDIREQQDRMINKIDRMKEEGRKQPSRGCCPFFSQWLSARPR